jgi:2-methylcitrate dehydratase PrpD
MESERLVARYVTDTAYEELPEKPVTIAREVMLTVLGTTIAGANAEGCEALVRQVRQWGGRKLFSCMAARCRLIMLPW